jgi:hypothetical protein
MQKVTLHIEIHSEKRTVLLDEELSIGRTDLAGIMLEDIGLSRINTTFFRDGDAVLVVDEKSLNGTYLNGEKLGERPREIGHGDLVKIGSSTHIRIEIGEREKQKAAEPPSFETSPQHFDIRRGKRIATADEKPAQIGGIASVTKRPQFLLIAAGASTFLILIFGLIAYLVVSRKDSGPGNSGRRDSPPPVIRSELIPVRVIDPLGGEDPEDLDDLISSWEVEEKEIDASTVADVNVASADAEETELNVTAAFLAEQQARAFAPRNGETGIRPAGLNVPRQLFGDGVIKQKAKLREMNTTLGYKQPMDFAELAQKRLSRELIEMPMATKSFYLAVGGSAGDGPFKSFSFQTEPAEIAPGTPKYQTLAQLAGNFAGQKYDLNNPADRKQMRMRLLRMFNQRAKPILKELADAYAAKFNRPLRVTSLTRSMDYQIGLNATNANSFKVRGEGSLPPHTSGCAFDLARKHMTADEQNFVMAKLAEMEDAGRLDALIEYGTNACFHVFIYSDGIPPRM